jgi:methylenetetrahydrofolate dehydrogenase (NADP+)/methenyltetrahydrofolate cyclohydrolase
MQIIKEYVAEKKNKLKHTVNENDNLKMVIVQVGHVPASDRYVRNKIRDAEEVGILCELNNLPEDISEEALLTLMEGLNHDDSVTGYLVQLPLPKHISEEKVKLAIAPEKDIDGFHPLSKTVPATPLGIYNYLKDMGYEFQGKNAVVIGRSNIVGKPMAQLLLKESMNVTVLHSKTAPEDKRFYLAHADLIVVATGHINTLNDSYLLKEDAVVFDVGINVGIDGKLIGDCAKGLPVAFQSPVPGGVGLLTRIAVIDNLIELSK